MRTAQEQVDALLTAPGLAPGLVAPRYDGWGIANVAPTILKIFGIGDEHPTLPDEVLPPALLAGVRRVVVLIVDAFGWQQLHTELANQPDLPLHQLLHQPHVSLAPLTSVFPSTTVNALTTANTGAQPAEHGILGYTLWLKEFGAVSEMITFGPYAANEWSYAQEGVNPAEFQPCPSIFARTHEAANVASYLVNPAIFRRSPLSQMQATGATYVSYIGLSDALTHIRRLVETPGDEPMLIGGYYPQLDTICHAYGTHTPQHAAEVAQILTALDRELFSAITRDDTLIMLYADHGHINCDDEHTIDLNEDDALMRDLQVFPTGEGRARYLHVRNGRLDAVQEHLTAQYGGFSTLLTADEALAQGLFGTRPATAQARDRIGDLVLVPHENYYFHSYPAIPARKKLTMIGRHGGLTPEEMLVPFLAVRPGAR